MLFSGAKNDNGLGSSQLLSHELSSVAAVAATAMYDIDRFMLAYIVKLRLMFQVRGVRSPCSGSPRYHPVMTNALRTVSEIVALSIHSLLIHFLGRRYERAMLSMRTKSLRT